MFNRKKDDPRFETVHEENEGLGNQYSIILDTITGVEYLFVHEGNAGGLTPLLGADGRPLIRTVLDEGGGWDDEE